MGRSLWFSALLILCMSGCEQPMGDFQIVVGENGCIAHVRIDDWEGEKKYKTEIYPNARRAIVEDMFGRIQVYKQRDPVVLTTSDSLKSSDPNRVLGLNPKIELARRKLHGLPWSDEPVALPTKDEERRASSQPVKAVDESVKVHSAENTGVDGYK